MMTRGRLRTAKAHTHWKGSNDSREETQLDFLVRFPVLNNVPDKEDSEPNSAEGHHFLILTRHHPQGFSTSLNK